MQMFEKNVEVMRKVWTSNSDSAQLFDRELGSESFQLAVEIGVNAQHHEDDSPPRGKLSYIFILSFSFSFSFCR
jgi:hypothetical protein